MAADFSFENESHIKSKHLSFFFLFLFFLSGLSPFYFTSNIKLIINTTLTYQNCMGTKYTAAIAAVGKTRARQHDGNYPSLCWFSFQNCPSSKLVALPRLKRSVCLTEYRVFEIGDFFSPRLFALPKLKNPVCLFNYEQGQIMTFWNHQANEIMGSPSHRVTL